MNQEVQEWHCRKRLKCSDWPVKACVFDTAGNWLCIGNGVSNAHTAADQLDLGSRQQSNTVHPSGFHSIRGSPETLPLL
ncbi:unnamed protein product [Pleuronectes platessa]|uniref:Uncharacterized protein n=1 Tax=Pleuronectes platessa TaxID=8262 RepID=A0A9N7YB83_PLEPL|nr:unnamed protein product [Pleuronectes platessa]